MTQSLVDVAKCIQSSRSGRRTPVQEWGGGGEAVPHALPGSSWPQGSHLCASQIVLLWVPLVLQTSWDCVGGLCFSPQIKAMN